MKLLPIARTIFYSGKGFDRRPLDRSLLSKTTCPFSHLLAKISVVADRRFSSKLKSSIRVDQMILQPLFVDLFL
jgi:hypothetical protein